MFGRGASRLQSLRVMKYLDMRTFFHHYEAPETSLHCYFSPKVTFISVGSIISKPYLSNCLQTFFQLTRGNFFVFVFPPSLEKNSNIFREFFKHSFRCEQGYTLKYG
jgi:hypothetical protein